MVLENTSSAKMYRKVLCPAKINLLLRVGPRRSDGYHEIQTLMAPIKFGDFLSLRICRSKQTTIRLKSADLKLKPEKNLVYRAAEAFSREFKVSFKAEFYLEKKVPTGAGLGGGSSDAAKTLELLAQFFFGKSQTSSQFSRLNKVAAKLGADIPFFLYQSAAFCTGFGEKCLPVKLNKFSLLLVLPREKVPTPWAYGELDRFRAAKRWNKKFPPFRFEDFSEKLPPLVNDFEEVVLLRKPSLQRYLNLLAESGAVAARMSGSGSAFFGIFTNLSEAKKAQKIFSKNKINSVVTETLQ